MSVKWKDFYTSEAQGYDTRRYQSWYGRIFSSLQRRSVEECLQRFIQPGLTLEVASGTGQTLPALLPGSRLVIASDLTDAMLRVSREKHPGSRVLYAVNDAFRLPFADETFDVVASSRFLHLFQLEQQKQLLVEMARVLRPGGILIVDFYNRSHWRLLSPAIHLYRRLLKKRPLEDTFNSVTEARKMLADLGLEETECLGLGSYLLVLLRYLPDAWACRAGALFRKPPGLSLAEQFLICARKTA